MIKKLQTSRDSSVDSSPDHLPRSLVNPRAAARRVGDDFLRHRRLERLRRLSNWRNPVVNPRVRFQDNNREGPVTQ